MDSKVTNDANYDRNITSAETAARMEREQGEFKDNSPDGQTVDREGLANNYAVEPEMYYEEPGDRQEVEAAEQLERAKEVEDVNTPGGKGVGLV